MKRILRYFRAGHFERDLAAEMQAHLDEKIEEFVMEGLSPEEARASIRFSLGRHTMQTEIAASLEIVPAAVAQLRELSPAYQK